jgi:hypothetical protein
MHRRNRLTWLLIAVFATFLCLTTITGKAFTQSSSPSVSKSDTLFQPIVSEIVKSGVPLRLPTYIPSTGQRRNSEGTPPKDVYASVNMVSDGIYLVSIGYTKACTGGNACRLGTVEGDRKTVQTPPIEEVYSFMMDSKFKGVRSEQKMSTVSLAKDTEGWFIPWICGANCNDAKVVWDEGSFRYLVGIKLGDKNALIEMANSAISNGL